MIGAMWELTRRSLFHSAGISPEDIRTVDDLKYVPVTEKEELRAAGPYGAVAEGVDLSSCGRCRTSGSTGKPFDTYLNRYDRWRRRLLGLRRLLDMGFRPQDRLCILCDPTQLPSRRFRTECLSPLLPLETQVQTLQKMQPTLLKAWPSSLRALFHYTDYHLGDYIRPRAVITSGEVCDGSLRKRIQDTLGAETFSFYAAGELGMIASECRAHEGLHVNADQLIFECLKNGEPAEIGEEGVVVLTSLFAFTMPFIRYRLGDICTISKEYCSCGSSFPLIQGPVGKQEDEIRMPDGKVLSVSAVLNITLRPFDGIDRYRLIQETPTDFVLQVAFMKYPGTETLSEIKKRMIEALGKPVSLEVQVLDFIRDEEELKFSRFISKVPEFDL